MAYERQKGEIHPMLLNGPSLPDGCEQLWTDFLELHARRGATGFGPAHISFADIDGWQRVRRVALPAWQIDAICQADSAYLAEVAKRSKPA